MAGTMSGRVLAAATAAALLALAACGSGDDDQSSDGGGAGGLSSDTGRTVNIEMRDNEFSPTTIEVPAGQEVRLVFRNRGDVTHDAVVGDEAAQAEHEDEMRAAETDASDDGDMAGMGDGEMGEGDTTTGMGHGDETGEGGITVDPGETGEITHTFEAGDQMLVGCHQEGHYDAGMKITVDVT
jgi:uncharacterized cupredoxin-like copper-binding protein